ncbi:MAG: hypothetical protein MSG64_00680 [Pyrinomonadaceae bacterium MAG19_C2-C3]|nr:hypothetical protein [Pyrinomonadaceae bacterium MAG19_C2-C3]
MNPRADIIKVPDAFPNNKSLFDLTEDKELWDIVKNDPVTALLLSGEASTVHEAEVKFLNGNVEVISQLVLELVESNLSDEEFSRHPLILLVRGHGSRRWEDSLL